ncbi:MAG: DNA gyrase inhibitor YacG [Alphaproteobacteria bacterium]|nr:DNA gyrase inhibitor YacG [Alphaproteobacteria bacterium]|tara:strand:- start:378 stop:560 length:183 start_codon:yes stop_codon:yes gene_type:complete
MANTCPICSKPVQDKHRPFCSERCANVDLSRWLGGSYRIPTEEPPTVYEGGLDEGEEEQG